MAKIKAFLRVSKTRRGWKVEASGKPNYLPLKTSGYAQENLPTVAFGLLLDIPDVAFEDDGQIIAEVSLPEDKLKRTAKVTPV